MASPNAIHLDAEQATDLIKLVLEMMSASTDENVRQVLRRVANYILDDDLHSAISSLVKTALHADITFVLLDDLA